MKRFDWVTANVLQQRLKDAGKSPVSNYSIKKIRRDGISLGISIILLASSLCFGTYIYSRKLLAHKKNLEILVQEFDLIDKKYRKTLKIVSNIKNINSEIASGIAGIKSGSALMSEIRRNMPKTVQIEKLVSNELQLDTFGVANQPYGLFSINAFKIQLENSIFVNENHVKLEKAWLSKTSGSRKNEIDSILKFKINAKFSNNYNSKLIKYLEELGSEGLAKRVSILTREGLIK